MAERTRFVSVMQFRRGATRPGLLDILTALILLGILVWASWKQFPAYHRQFRTEAAAPTTALRPSPAEGK
jgi:hypothetical protein